MAFDQGDFYKYRKVGWTIFGDTLRSFKTSRPQGEIIRELLGLGATEIKIFQPDGLNFLVLLIIARLSPDVYFWAGVSDQP